MKKNSFLFLFILIGFFVNAQEKYTITKIIGKIKSENGSFLKPGNILQKNPTLVYSSSQDGIRAIGNNGKVYLFTASKNATKNSQGLFTAVLSQFVRTESGGNMSTRAISDEINWVQENLNYSGKILLTDENRYLFDVKKYNVNDGNLFFIQINKKDDYEDKNTEWRKLKTNGDTLYIRYIDIIPKDGNLENTDFKLGYFYVKKNISSDVLGVPLHFVYDVVNDLENITKTTIEAYKNNPKFTKEKIREVAYQQILENLGKPSDIEFLKIFEKLYSQKNIEIQKPTQDFGTGYQEEKEIKIPEVSNRYKSLTRAELPSSYTLKRFAPPVANQGMTGTCTSWATSYSARSILYNTTHNFVGEDQKKTSFSPEFIYFKIRKDNGCRNGTYISDALETRTKIGTVISSDKTFDCKKTFSETDFTSANHYKIKGSEYLISDDRDIVSIVKETLALRNQPVIVGLKLPKNSKGESSFHDIGSDGIWRITPEEYEILKNPEIKKSGHAVTIIGYDDNPAILGGAFEIMNSWGTDFWGKKGFCWIAYDDLAKVISSAFTITDLSDVPPANIEIPVKPTPTKEKLNYNGEISFYSVNENGEKIIDFDLEKTPNTDHLNTFKIIPVLENNSRYKINYTSKAPSFLYLINYDGYQVDSLFPYDFSKENAIIDMKEALLVLPDFNKGYRLGNENTKEQMCFIISKNELDIKNIIEKIKKEKPHPDQFKNFMNGIFKNSTENVLINIQKSNFQFSAETNQENPIPLMIFIDLKHEEIKQYQ